MVSVISCIGRAYEPKWPVLNSPLFVQHKTRALQRTLQLVRCSKLYLALRSVTVREPAEPQLNQVPGMSTTMEAGLVLRQGIA